MALSIWVALYAYFVVSLCILFPGPTTALPLGSASEGEGPVPAKHGTVVKKDERWRVSSSEFGEISAAKVSDGRGGFYHLQFITLEPNSLFLPVNLHSDMVFYVASGSGTLSWTDLGEDDNSLRKVQLQAGDVYRLRIGAFFYLQSNLDSDRRKLRINAIFSDTRDEEGTSFGPYASVRDLVLGFDSKVLEAALNVEEGVIQELQRERQPLIVHGVAEVNGLWEVHYGIMRSFLGRMNKVMIDVNKKKKHKEKKSKTEEETKAKTEEDQAYNIQEAEADVKNCNGWSLVVTPQQLEALNGPDFGVFMVNLTRGAMMGPHWNPTTAEIAVVLQGRGMVHVVCPSTAKETECKKWRFRVEEGDVFVVPRYHPMAQMSFNNGSFVFMGFTTTLKNNHPQYLAGKASVLQTLDKMVLAASFGVSNSTMDTVLAAQREAIILECVSCAEEEERLMEEEMEEKKREEEAARKKEEEKKKKEEEEEEEAKEREEAARRRKEEEEAARKREQEEEEAARKRKEEEEAARQREEEEAARQQEEEAARQREEEEAEEAARQREEEAARQREEEEEEEAARQREEEAARQREEEEAARQREKEEAARQREEEEAARRREEEEARRQKEEGGGEGEGGAARKAEEEMERRQREAEAAAARGGGGRHEE